ncbi:hypothetical protein AAFX91_01030 [Bradyrhizobium sp. 31Argb]|uniref:hypothetical protein n=1 Tax=unclassified Bradyrhizobium TaxID=2631580 RepID=UPI001FDFDF80|nr:MULTISPECIES: hypothetical protein [unclassified Bradyrhizobium]MDI4234866.1 hypothetical protein [Bradyrhizobium sp. Arg237L]
MNQNNEQQQTLEILEAQATTVSEGGGLPALSQQALPELTDAQDIAAQWLGTNSNALNAIERLTATIDEETDKLESRTQVDFDSFSQRKNRGLLELTRAMRVTQGIEFDPRVVAHLTRLRAGLVRNQAALQMHLDAVREVSAIIARSIQEVESDGTYSLMGQGGCK